MSFFKPDNFDGLKLSFGEKQDVCLRANAKRDEALEGAIKLFLMIRSAPWPNCQCDRETGWWCPMCVVGSETESWLSKYGGEK